MRRSSLLLLGALATGGIVLAQFGPPDRDYRTAREAADYSDQEAPVWSSDPEFERDVFTFARVHYSRSPHAWRSAGHWLTDLPDSDLNFSFRLQQMTALRVDPAGRVVKLTDPELFEFPWIYMVEPGGLLFEEEEVPILRKYLLNGGFLMADDFWGEREWENFESEIRRVLPEKQFVELPLDHPVYHSVFEIDSKSQVPNVFLGTRSQYNGVTWERPDAREVHHRAILDDKGRIMVIACHNTDNGDGWEREGDNEYYFRNFSERIAYPLGINIVFYAMTH